MSDERWLTKETRAQSWDAPSGTWQRMLCDHAEAADELIAELAACLRTHVAFSTTADGTCAWPEHSAGGMAYYNSTDTLARVDALTKDTA